MPNQSANPSALPAGTRLGEFELLRLLGVGGFGIVYLAFDHALEREVAVKEYMPASLAGRTETMRLLFGAEESTALFSAKWRGGGGQPSSRRFGGGHLDHGRGKSRRMCGSPCQSSL